MNLTRILGLAAVLTAAATTNSMALLWGPSGSSKTMNWSDANNWNNDDLSQSLYPPAANTSAVFENVYFTGFTNVLGAVNNIVDTNFSIGAAQYTSYANGPTNSTGVNTNAFYTTLIPAGVSLTLGDASYAGSGVIATLAVGD